MKGEALMMKKKIGADFFAEFTNLCGFETVLWLLDSEREESR